MDPYIQALHVYAPVGSIYARALRVLDYERAALAAMDEVTLTAFDVLDALVGQTPHGCTRDNCCVACAAFMGVPERRNGREVIS